MTASRVPFVDLGSQYQSIKSEIDTAIASVLSRSAFVLGPECEEFERAFAAYVGTRWCVGVGSGTDALELAVRALGIGPGDEVICPANTFIATCEAVTLAGAGVRLVDADPVTYGLDPAQFEAAITSRTRAVIPVHLYGQPADMDPILDIAHRHGLKVIEDCAQAHGATYRGRQAGTLGHVACFSFYASKNLGAYGDAGALCTDDEEVAHMARLLSNHGQDVRYEHQVVGSCHRLDNLQAAVLGVKLPHLDAWNRARQSVAEQYDELLHGVPGVTPPAVAEGRTHVYHLYVVQVSDRDGVRSRLQASDVETGIHYPIPVHEQPAYAGLGHRRDDFPVASAAARRILSLPMYPELTEEQVARVVEALNAAVAS